MDKDTNNNNNNHLVHHHSPSSLLLPLKQEPPGISPAPIAAVGGGSAGGDRLKRDEWSEGAVSTLLEAYESKWVLRNRAKLKGHDWEDVARLVSSRANCTKSPKTQTQCKNKIESMKKRYRSESAAADLSSWPLYPRLDMLLRGTTAAALPQPAPPPIINPPPLVMLEPPPLPAPPPPLPPQAAPLGPPPGMTQNSHGSNGIDHDRLPVKEDGVGTKVSVQESDKDPIETDSSTPALYSNDTPDMKSKKLNMIKRKKKKKSVGGRRSMKKMGSGSSEERGIAQSIRWLAEAIVRSEQSRMETMKEVERMRIEAEAKRGEMDLKRTEIIANTQLEIARLLAGGSGKGIDSSLRIGRN